MEGLEYDNAMEHYYTLKASINHCVCSGHCNIYSIKTN